MDWRARVRAAFATLPHRPEPDVVEELALHLQAMYEAARAEGGSPDEAESRIARQLDLWRQDAAALRHRRSCEPAVEPPTETSRAPLTGLAHDLRYAARLLRRQSGFTLLATLTMALGIGFSTVVFSVAYGVLVKPLPWPAADRLVVVRETRGGMRPRFRSFTNAAYLAWRDAASTLDELAAWSTRMVTLTGAGEPDRLQVTAGTASLFRVLRVRPLIGDFFDDAAEGTPVVVLSESLWRQRFAADPAILGRTLTLDGTAYTIVGVLADRYAFPDHRSRAWIPFLVRPTAGNSLSMFDAAARLREGATPAQAAAEGTARGRFVADTGLTTKAVFGSDGPVEIAVMPLDKAMTGGVRRPLLILVAAVLMLLAIATSNIASLQLARATTRRRELAIRAALGAGRHRLIRQLAAEGLLVGLAGGAGGLGFAWALHRALPAILPADFPRLAEMTVGYVVIAFAVGVSVVTGTAFGIVPALRLRRHELAVALAEDGGSPVGVGRRTIVARARLLILAGQIAIASMLLVGASLVGRSFFELLHADRGFDPSSVVSARLSLAAPLYTNERRRAVLAQILERLDALPDVRAAAVTSEDPLTPGGSTGAFVMPSRDSRGGTVSVQASPRVISDQFFAALGLRTLAGRPFAPADNGESTQPGVVVNESFARRYLGEPAAAVGATVPGDFWGLDRPDATIIGVVEDVKYVGSREIAQPEMHYLLGQMQSRVELPAVTLLVRADRHPRAVAAMLRNVIREADEKLVAEGVMTLEDGLRTTSLVRPRLYAVLLGIFASLALALTAVGLFAVLSYVVAQRTRELGVRAALGAPRAALVRLVVTQGLGVAIAGLAGGLVFSALAARALSALLYGITPLDPLTYAGVAIVLLAVAALACATPAYRAAQLDPLSALRS